MIHEHRVTDWLAWALGAASVFSFWQGVALAITILTGLGSLSLICLRWHDRLKYGPPRR